MRFLLLLLLSFSAFGNSYYTPSGVPAQGAVLSSAPLRNEFVSIQSGFNKLPDLTALPSNDFILVNSSGSGLVPVVPSTALGLLSPNLANLASVTPGALGESILSTATGFTFNLPMGGYKITGLGSGTASGDSVEYSQFQSNLATLISGVQKDSYKYAVDTGTVNAYSISLSPNPTLATGMVIGFVTANTSTSTTPTLSVNGTTAPLTLQGGAAITSGQIQSGSVNYVAYNAAIPRFELLSPTFSTTAQAQGLSSTLSAITPYTLSQSEKGANQSLSTSGYQIFPGGLIINWGSVTTSGGGVANVTFQKTFPTAALSVSLAIVSGSPVGELFGYNYLTTSGMTIYTNTTIGGAAYATVTYIALGY